MKIEELYEKLGKLLENKYNRGLEIVIRTYDPAVGPASFAQITGFGQGIDWDHGKMFMYTDKKLITKKEKPK